MAPKYLAMLVFIWVVGSLMGAVIEGSTLGIGEQGVLDDLLSWKELQIDQVWDVFKIPVAVGNFFVAMFSMLTFRFAFLEDNYYAQLFRWIVLSPIIAIFITSSRV